MVESTYHSFKVEFILQETSHTLEELILKTKDYVRLYSY
ncbi:MAG: hypothetical protein D8H99_23475 [Streptococcus sp.]|nr:MAG: hypothetical protein D8H99_23475 [Streptococcus sp.]